MSKVYDFVTQAIIEKLEKGTVPWRKPFINCTAVNWLTQKPYRGINAFLLDGGEYATFKQISQNGGKVKKGEKGNLIVFWKWIEREDEKTGEIKEVPLLRYYKVFEINTQCEGLKSRRRSISFDHDPIEEAESVIKKYKPAPSFTHKSGSAYYLPSKDVVNVPPMKDFKKAEEYYSVFFHEMVHSTGHSSRLNREGVTQRASFGSELYSKEELVAELGAAMLCATVGIDNDTIDNSASYINGWLRSLKNDNRLIVQAAAQAQKAADFIIGNNEN